MRNAILDLLRWVYPQFENMNADTKESILFFLTFISFGVLAFLLIKFLFKKGGKNK